MATVNDLVDQVLGRIEESNPPVFWDLSGEVYSSVVEGMCDLLLLVGRPDLIVAKPFQIQPNTPWQTTPAGMFCITGMQGNASEVWKISLQDLDYAQVAGADWEQDIGDTVQKWAPVGLNRFVVWPCVEVEQTVLLTGIASPVTQLWPYLAEDSVAINDEFLVALEMYAAHYLRFKEATNEFSESGKLYQQYMEIAKRMTTLEDRRDPYIFNAATGAQAQSNPTKTR